MRGFSPAEITMDTEEIIKRLKNPQQYRQSQPAEMRPLGAETPGPLMPVQRETKKASLEMVVAGATIVLFFITLGLWMMSKNRAENLTAALDPDQVKGLSLEAEFNPHTGVTYIEVHEGQDRNVAVSNLGSTLPIISRFNFKTLTDKNYEVIGAAPWALTTNFESNISDPEVIAYLLANDTMIQAFLTRPDVEPLLEDPQLLRAFAEDEAALQNFFAESTVQAVLADTQMVRTVMGSRFMSHLLISKSAKYFRNHPQEAVQIINQSPSLSALRQNEGVVAAVKENPYLKNLANTLLAAPSKPVAAAQPKPAAKQTAKSSGKTKTSRTKTNNRKK